MTPMVLVINVLFLLLQDLKKYHFYYWFCFPVLCFAEAIPVIQEPVALSQKFSAKQVSSGWDTFWKLIYLIIQIHYRDIWGPFVFAWYLTRKTTSDYVFLWQNCYLGLYSESMTLFCILCLYFAAVDIWPPGSLWQSLHCQQHHSPPLLPHPIHRGGSEGCSYTRMGDFLHRLQEGTLYSCIYDRVPQRNNSPCYL